MTLTAMQAVCPACERAVGRQAFRCPYCDEKIPMPRSQRWAVAILALVTLSALGWGWARAGSATPPPSSVMAGLLADRRAAILLALAAMLLLMPAACRPSLPGAAARGTGVQTLGDAMLSLACSAGLLAAALLLGWPVARLPGCLALMALALLSWLLRRPAYPLLAVPLVSLACLLAAF